MSAPVILAISPSAGSKDVVLGANIMVTFDQAVDPATVNESTFSLMGPGQTGLINPEQLLKSDPHSVTGREYITGKFSWPSPNVLVFDPDKSLRPNVKYTVLLAGAGGMVVRDAIKSTSGEPLLKSVQISFQTGALDLTDTPVQSPLPWNDPQVQPWMRPKLKPDDIIVHPRRVVGNDLAQVIELVFPAPLDPRSFKIEDVGVSVEALADDPLVNVPAGLTVTPEIQGNRLIITISGWTL